MKALIALALVAAAPASPKFDLVCTASVNAEAPDAFTPADLHLRVDLTAKKWCLGECKAIHDIAEVQPGQIWFEKESEAEQEQRLMHWSSVDRETGDYKSVHQFFILNNRETVALSSHCERAPFSGFPAVTTKF
jgi:hypothetical protein